MTNGPTHVSPALEHIRRQLPEEPTEVVVARVSKHGLQEIANVSETSRRVHADLPAVQYLASLPTDILADTALGDELRHQHDVVTLRRRDASPYAQNPNLVMGYAIAAPPNGVLLFIHDSAAHDNVYVPGDPLPRVAFSEFMVLLFFTFPSLANAHFANWQRMMRSHSAAQRMYEASIRCGTQLWVGGTPVDLISSGGRMMAGIEGTQSAGERDLIRKRTTGGVLNALNSGGDAGTPAWPYAESLLPLGYGLLRDLDGKVRTRMGEKGARWKLIAPDPGEAAALRECLSLFVAGRSWPEAAEPLATAQVRCRGQNLWGKTYDQLPRKQRGNALRNMVTEPNNRQLWLTGRYVRTKAVPIPTGGTFEGFEVRPEHGTYGFIDVDVHLGLPDGGFLDAGTAARLEERLKRRERKDGERSTTCAMFSHLLPYRDTGDADFTWERRIYRTGDTYVVRERPAADSVNDRGRAVGWDRQEGRHILTLRRRDFEQAVAAEVESAVRSVACHQLAVNLRTPGTGDALELLRQQLDEQRARRDEAGAAGELADRAAQIAAAPGPTFDAQAVARHSATATKHYATADQCDLRIDKLTAELANLDTTDVTATADLGTPAALAGCLRGYAGHEMPLAVNKVLRELGLDTLRIDADPQNSRRARWSLDLTLPLANGGVATIPVRGTIRNRRRDQHYRLTLEQVDQGLAEGFLKDARSLEDLGREYGLTRPIVVTRLRTWLSRQGVARRGLRGAVVDLPVEMAETRLALWSVCSGDLEAASHLKELRSHLARAYLDAEKHPNAWVRTDCALARRALRAMVEGLPQSAQHGVTVEALARSLGASQAEISRLCGDRAGTGATRGRFTGILVRDPLNAGVLRLRQCPHPDCTAAEGYRWLSHYLPVPETDGYHGLICPACYRLPDPNLRDLRLPNAYVDHLWDGPADATNFDLKSGPATREAEPAEYRPATSLPRRRVQYALTEAAERLGITDRALRTWVLDPEDPLPSGKIAGPGGTKYAISAETLTTALDHPRALQLRRTAPREADPVGQEYVTLKQIAASTGVAEHYLRDRARAGLLGPVAYRRLDSRGRAALVLTAEILDPAAPASAAALPAEWVARHQAHLLLIGPAAERAGRTVSMLRTAVAAGDLRSVQTDGGTHLFDSAEVRRWASETGVLTARQAAHRAGASIDQVRHAVRLGALLPVSRTRGGHRRFTAGDVDDWAASRADIAGNASSR